ncbi:MAG: PIN domain-containing protein [Halococcoides sp.]
MTAYVFDTEAIIAYFYDEPGADAVTERLQAVEGDAATGAISHATATEVAYKIARLETGDPNHTTPGEAEYAVGTHDLRVLRGFGVTIDTPSWQTVAQIKGAGGISLGDASAAGLALDQEATLVVGADPEFHDLSADISIDRIRNTPV